MGAGLGSVTDTLAKPLLFHECSAEPQAADWTFNLLHQRSLASGMKRDNLEEAKSLTHNQAGYAGDDWTLPAGHCLWNSLRGDGKFTAPAESTVDVEWHVMKSWAACTPRHIFTWRKEKITSVLHHPAACHNHKGLFTHRGDCKPPVGWDSRT